MAGRGCDDGGRGVRDGGGSEPRSRETALLGSACAGLEMGRWLDGERLDAGGNASGHDEDGRDDGG